MAKRSLALLLLPMMATAGTRYQMTVRDLTKPSAAPAVIKVFVQGDALRIESTDTNPVLIFKDGVNYIIDHAAHREAQPRGNSIRPPR
jgi:hypothetical protein